MRSPALSLLHTIALLGYLYAYVCAWLVQRQQQQQLTIAAAAAVKVAAKLWPCACQCQLP